MEIKMKETLEEFRTRCHHINISYDELSKWYYELEKENIKLKNEIKELKNEMTKFKLNIKNCLIKWKIN